MNKKNCASKEIMVFPLNLPQRTALWISLDLLDFSKETNDAAAAMKICKRLQKLDGKDQFIDFELGISDARLAAHALVFAVQYLNGLHPYIDETFPAFSRLAKELREHSPVVRNLWHRFREFV